MDAKFDWKPCSWLNTVDILNFTFNIFTKITIFFLIERIM